MKLSFDNLGPIKKIDLDLSKKLIVFCGPNGTGKTYACYAIYGYLRPLLRGLNLFELDDLLRKKHLQITLNYTELYNFQSRYFKFLKGSVKNIFGEKSSGFFKSFKVSGGLSEEQFAIFLKQSKFKTICDSKGISVTYKKDGNSDILHISANESTVLETKSTETAEIYHLACITKVLCNSGLFHSYILPVERNSAYTFANELAAKKMTEVFQEPQGQNYPLPIKDILSTAVNLKNIKANNSKYFSLAKMIEEDILHGNISVSEDGDLQFACEKNKDIVLPIHLTASIVKNISGLLVYLKHQARDNELLIIDEPEIGLHPDNQILLTRIFAKMINAGVKLLICTHSDYIIRELNNLIILSSVNEEIEKKAKEYHYKPDEKINPEDVGVYLFDYNTCADRYVEVKPLPVTKRGFEVESIEQAIGNMNDRSMDLYFSLKEENND
jgi:energy-coupling factor transporter ATP-binding protein EcfA2